MRQRTNPLTGSILAVALMWAAAQPVAASTPGLPGDLTAFQKRWQLEATTPEGATRLLFDAIYVTMNPATRTAGLEMLRVAMGEQPGWENRNTHRLFVQRMTDPAHAHIFRSYARGATPENGYRMDPGHYELVIEKVWHEHPKGTQVVLRSGGADFPRPIYLARRGGVWIARDVDNLKVGIRPPAAGD